MLQSEEKILVIRNFVLYTMKTDTGYSAYYNIEYDEDTIRNYDCVGIAFASFL